MTFSVPSWVIPGTYAENLRFLEDKAFVRGVELLFFIYDDEARDLFLKEAEAIRAFSGRFRFTAHLPDPLLPEHEALVEATADLVDSWVVHPGPPESAPFMATLLRLWRARYGDRFFLENVKPQRREALLGLLPDIPLCLDTGHLLLQGLDPAAEAALRGGSIREVHLHGLGAGGEAVSDGRLPDHRPFPADAPWFAALVPFLSSFDGVVDAEVFSWNETRAIAACLQQRGLLAPGSIA